MRAAALTLTLSLTAGALAGQVQGPPSITHITTLPLGDAGFSGSLVGSPDGRLVYYTTGAEVKVYDRAARTTSVVVKGDFFDIATSRSGDRMIMTRLAEGTTPAPGAASFIWTVTLNPRTGIATGEPRKVSTISAMSPAFSPDGKWIAFIAKGNPRRMMVIPSEGGVERVLFERGGPRAPVQWSPDGKWIYFSQAAGNGQPGTAISRVSIDSGTPARIAVVGDVGMVAPDGRHLIGLGGNLKGVTAAVFEMDGTPDGIPRTVTSLDGMPAGFGSSGTGLKLVVVVVEPHLSLRARSIASGAERTIPLGGHELTAEVLSPDGKHIAAAVPGDTSLYAFATMNADGSERRVVHAIQSWDLDAYTWSPDGKYVAFTGDKRLSLYVDELATGRVTKVGSADLHVTDYRWLPDSRTLLYTRQDGTPTAARVSIHQTSLGGQDRLLRDLTPELPPQDENWSATTWILGDSAALVIRQGLVFPLAGGPPRRAYDHLKIGLSDDGAVPAVSGDGHWIAIPAADRRAFDVLAADGGNRHTLQVPGTTAIVKPMLFLPDNRAVVVAVDSSTTSRAAIYLVPVDGTAPRVLVTLGPGEAVRNFSLSPDGGTLLYERVGPGTLELIEADLGAGLAVGPAIKHQE